jgi:hypothetical protein
MVRERNEGRPAVGDEGEPFATVEEAWLWYARCQVARDDGARVVAGLGRIERPCEPDDIAREVTRLYRGRRLCRAHVEILGRFGRRMAPPTRWAGNSAAEIGLWREALARLAPVLRHKGIVA